MEFAEGDCVRVVEHPGHALPPVLEDCAGWVGNIAKVKDGDLYDVNLDDADPVPTVQLHADQLERRRICRVCGCTNNHPCTRTTAKSNWTCGWAEDDLCTACTPGAAADWVHPPAVEGEGN